MDANTIKMTNINVSVPSEIFLALRENENQFVSNMTKQMALNLFETRKLSIGQCAALANMQEEDFIFFLSENKVSIFDYLDETELSVEMNNA